MLCEKDFDVHMEIHAYTVHSTSQECLEKCGESLQEMVNYHTVRHICTHTRTDTLYVVATGERLRYSAVWKCPGLLTY